MLDSYEFEGFTYVVDVQEEDDNRKNIHLFIEPDNTTTQLDFSPYDTMDKESFQRFVKYFKQHGHLPGREKLGMTGPLHKEQLEQIVGAL